MAKRFNINGLCTPSRHYMVDIESRLEQIKLLIDNGDYFVINRARQYGKTTTIYMLTEELESHYVIFSISFEGMADAAFKNEKAFCRRVYGLLYDAIFFQEVCGVSDVIKDKCNAMSQQDGPETDLRELSNFISGLCSGIPKPVILIIDEVDQASNQEIFLAFLGMLRDKYLRRDKRATFQSVILAGVYDIKNLKLRIRKDDEHQYNSPWNIAASFNVDMSFSINDIAGMLQEYETDADTGMNITDIAVQIFDYTSGYPYLVSRLCKLLDEELLGKNGFHTKNEVWTRNGITEAVKELLKENNTLFDDMIKKMNDYPELRNMLYAILFNGKSIPYTPYNHAINIGTMFGFLKEQEGVTAVSNRIFEMELYNLFLSEEIVNSGTYQTALLDKNQFIEDGRLNMKLVLKKFVEHFTDVYRDNDAKFIEENGRRLFLLYLKPIINGVGNYYIEAQTRDMRRTDVIVDYRGEQFIIEMKIWHGGEYNRRGELQLADYLSSYHLEKGYMLSFNFNKNKQIGLHEINCDGKTIIEAVV